MSAENPVASLITQVPNPSETNTTTTTISPTINEKQEESLNNQPISGKFYLYFLLTAIFILSYRKSLSSV
jgi:pseudouridine-5'-phosphate glycosidase